MITATAALTLWSGAASASVIASLTFPQPTGTVLSTDSIPVEVTLTLDPSSDPIKTDAAGNVTAGFTAADVNTYLFGGLPANVDPFNDSLSAIVEVQFSCTNTFTSGCGGPPYDINFNFQSSQTPLPNPSDTLFLASNLDLEPSDSVDFLLLTFTPTGGSAPPGTYSYVDVATFFQVFDNTVLDQNNNPLHIADIPIADTSNASPQFSRTVVGPEPGTLGLAVLSGFGLGWARRRFRAKP